MDAFEEFVNKTLEQKLSNPPGLLESHFSKRVSMLFHDVETYLKPFTENGSVTLMRDCITIMSWDGGIYNVEEMTVCIGEVRVRLTPLTASILGGFGRVDMIGPCEPEILLLTDEVRLRNFGLDVSRTEETSDESLQLTSWYFTRDKHYAFDKSSTYEVSVTENSFKEALIKVVEGETSR